MTTNLSTERTNSTPDNEETVMEIFWILFWQMIDEFAKWAARGKKRVSIATYNLRVKYLTRELHRLRTGKLMKLDPEGKLVRQPAYKLPRPQSLRGKHIDALMADWMARGLSPAYVHNMLSIFRLFTTWLGKSGLVGPTVDAVPDPAKKRRVQVATSDKSWSGRGIDVKAKIAEIAKHHPRIALMLELMRVFSLRLKEALLLKPWLADQGAYLDVNRGTKGGRDRTVPLDSPDKRELIERAKRMVEDRNACLIPRGRSYRQMQNHVYYVLDKFGISRKKVGISTHGLRHQGLNWKYEELTGAKSPVQGGKPGEVDAETDKFARQQVAEIAGHGRRKASSAYLGGVLRAKKTGKKQKASEDVSAAGESAASENHEHKQKQSEPSSPDDSTGVGEANKKETANGND